MAPKLAEIRKQQVIVEIMPGASGSFNLARNVAEFGLKPERGVMLASPRGTELRLPP